VLGLGPSAPLTLIRVLNTQELRVQSQRSRVPLVAWGFPWPKGELIHSDPQSPSQKCAYFVKREPQLVIDDPDKTLIAQFHEASLFKKEKSYLEVTLAGMGMLDHIIVTFIPVEVRRRED